MVELDRKGFARFVGELRREKGLTQKQLAEQLYVSDKAVSKWETAASMPDISLLMPLAELLGVTVTELLRGQRTQPRETMQPAQVEALVQTTIGLSEQERQGRACYTPRRLAVYLLCLGLAVAECLLLHRYGFTAGQLAQGLLTPMLLCAVFGGYFFLMARETLPRFYDENAINFFSDGFFRMNIPGVHFNNRNWPHILRAMRIFNAAALLTAPPLYFLLALLPQTGECAVLLLMLPYFLGLFLPLYILGRKYE